MNHSAMGWAESIKWLWKPGNSLRKGEGWHRKENVNEEQQQNGEHQQMNNNKMKIKNKEQQHHKNLTGGSPK